RRRDPKLRECNSVTTDSMIEIDLVAHEPDRRTPVVSHLCPIGVGEPEHKIGLGRAGTRTPHTLLLYGIVGLTNAGGVDDRHRIAVEVELHLDDVAGGAGMRRHDSDLAPRELIH